MFLFGKPEEEQLEPRRTLLPRTETGQSVQETVDNRQTKTLLPGVENHKEIQILKRQTQQDQSTLQKHNAPTSQEHNTPILQQDITPTLQEHNKPTLHERLLNYEQARARIFNSELTQHVTSCKLSKLRQRFGDKKTLPELYHRQLC